MIGFRGSRCLGDGKSQLVWIYGYVYSDRVGPRDGTGKGAGHASWHHSSIDYLAGIVATVWEEAEEEARPHGLPQNTEAILKYRGT